MLQLLQEAAQPCHGGYARVAFSPDSAVEDVRDVCCAAGTRAVSMNMGPALSGWLFDRVKAAVPDRWGKEHHVCNPPTALPCGKGPPPAWPMLAPTCACRMFGWVEGGEEGGGWQRAFVIMRGCTPFAALVPIAVGDLRLRLPYGPVVVAWGEVAGAPSFLPLLPSRHVYMY
jgi:hypothetical protein